MYICNGCLYNICLKLAYLQSYDYGVEFLCNYIGINSMKKRKYSQKEHDQVIFASLKTYEKYWKQGYIISINPGEKLCHDIGGGHFPDLVVWSSLSSNESIFNNKSTLIIEEVETEETINEVEAKQWESYAKYDATFFLIVPRNSLEKTKEIVKNREINVSMIQYYYFDAKKNIKFSTDFEKAIFK